MNRGTAKTEPAADDEPRTLAAAHMALWHVTPRAEAGPTQWRDFRTHSAQVYRQVAEVDLRHRHEALAWAAAERDEAANLTRQIKLESNQNKEKGAFK